MSKKVQRYRQFDIVQHTEYGTTATGMITVVGRRGDSSVTWFGEPHRHSAWWGPGELTIIGNAMTCIMDKMNGLCNGMDPNDQFPIEEQEVK